MALYRRGVRARAGASQSSGQPTLGGLGAGRRCKVLQEIHRHECCLHCCREVAAYRADWTWREAAAMNRCEVRVRRIANARQCPALDPVGSNPCGPPAVVSKRAKGLRPLKTRRPEDAPLFASSFFALLDRAREARKCQTNERPQVRARMPNRTRRRINKSRSRFRASDEYLARPRVSPFERSLGRS